MNDSAGNGSLTAPGRFGLPADYQQRLNPDYFADISDDGITWQPDVHPYAAGLARGLGRSVSIDIGCGRSGKLAALHQKAPDWQYIGAGYGANIEWCRANHAFGEWIEADLETCDTLPIPAGTARTALIVSPTS
jgi:hypothetical protein